MRILTIENTDFISLLIQMKDNLHKGINNFRAKLKSEITLPVGFRLFTPNFMELDCYFTKSKSPDNSAISKLHKRLLNNLKLFEVESFFDSITFSENFLENENITKILNSLSNGNIFKKESK